MNIARFPPRCKAIMQAIMVNRDDLAEERRAKKVRLTEGGCPESGYNDWRAIRGGKRLNTSANITDV